SICVRHDQWLPTIRVDDEIGSVNRLIAGVVGIRSRSEIAELVGTVVMAEREHCGRGRIADPGGRGHVNGLVVRVERAPLHHAIEQRLLGWEEVYQRTIRRKAYRAFLVRLTSLVRRSAQGSAGRRCD